MDVFIDVFQDALIDTVKLVPFLFVTYLVMEWLERKTAAKQASYLKKVGKLGPLYGGIAGVVPQCGFSASASSFFAGGLISVGTLLAVFLSTSDEMLPILVSHQVQFVTIGKILFGKMLMGVITGFVIDALLRKAHHDTTSHQHIHDLCKHDHCGCEDDHGSIFKSAIVHTLKITAFIFVITYILTFVVEGYGEDFIKSLFVGNTFVGIVFSAIVGLIPNCASSILISEMYLDGILSAGQMMAGLLVSAGVGLLVLFRSNRDFVENIKITGLLLVSGVAWGFLLEVAGIVF